MDGTVSAHSTNNSFYLIDSLNKYSGADSLFITGGHLYYVGRANKKDFAVALQNDSTIVFYQRVNATWDATDTLRSAEGGFGFHGVSVKDLNGDNRGDVIIAHDLIGSAGNTVNFVFLFDDRRNEFVHNQYYDLGNVRYISKSKLVGSSWFAGILHSQEKMTYKITGDSLTFNEGVTLFALETMAPDDTIGTLEFYKMKGEKRIVTKRIHADIDKLWDVFDKTYWDGEMEDD